MHIDTQVFSDVPEMVAERTSDKGPPVGTSISVILFPGEIIELHNTSISEHNADIFTWHGESKDKSVQAFFTVAGPNTLHGFIDIVDGPNYSINKIRGTAFHVISEVDPMVLDNKEF